MKIAVDIDNVIASSAESFIAFSNQLFGTELTLDDYSENRSAMWKVSQEESNRRGNILRDKAIQADYLPKEGAFETLKELRRKYEIILVTSRPKAADELTSTWVQRYFRDVLDDSQIIHAGFWDEYDQANAHLKHKGNIYRELKVDYVIDDHLKHCLGAVEAGSSALLFGNYPWNSLLELPAGIIRVSDWEKVKEYFDDQTESKI